VGDVDGSRRPDYDPPDGGLAYTAHVAAFASTRPGPWRPGAAGGHETVGEDSMNAATEPWTTIRYRDGFGSELNIELTLSADRHARLVRSGGSAVGEFVGRLAEWVIPELRAHLGDAGFPSLPKDPTGEYKGLLSVAGESGMFQAWIGLEHCQDPSIGQAVQLLEAVADALTDPTLGTHGPSARSLLSS
jgi:hypothetical protein